MFLRQCRFRSCIKLLSPYVSVQHTRTATVLRRVHKPPLLTKGSDASGRITQEDLDKEAIPQFWDGPSEKLRVDPWYLRYEVIEEDDDAVIPPVKVILMKSQFQIVQMTVSFPGQLFSPKYLLAAVVCPLFLAFCLLVCCS